MRKWKASLAAVFCLFFLVGCAGISGNSGTQSNAVEMTVTSYEGVALALNTAKAYIKGQELSGNLKGADLDAVIAKWEMGRTLFIQAGDALKLSLSAATPADRQTQIQLYNSLLMQAAQLAGQIQGGK